MSENLLRLRELAKLLDSGHITRKEFEQAKKRVLVEGPEPTSSPAPAPDFPPLVGSYRVLKLLGEGGMGRVFRARHRSKSFATRQGGDIALKVLHAQHARNANVRKRFEQEATLGISLNHPNIVRTFEMIVDEGYTGLVMELIEGQTLGQMLTQRGRPWTWAETRPLLSQLMDAVAYAHAEDVIHRDLKPENLILQPDGLLKILDFGIAKQTDVNLTQTGLGLGTTDYMSPEQYLNAKTVDPRADIYSMGIIIYQMLAGRLPWEPSSALEQILEMKKRGSFPPPTHFNPEIPAELSDLVLRMLEPAPSDRFKDMSALRASVAAVDHMVGQTVLIEPDGQVLQRPQPVRPASPRNWNLIFAMGFLFLFFLGMTAAGFAAYLHLDSDAFERSDDDDQAQEAEEEDDDDDELTVRNRARYRVRIRTDVPEQVHGLASELRTLGYKVRTQTHPKLTWSIHWNAAPDEMIEEILEIVTVEVETENEFERIEDAKVDTRDIVLNLTLLESPEELRAKHQVQILSNAPQKLSELTQKLDDAGYDWSTSELPVTQTELRWGSAPSWMIEEILDIIYEDEALLGDEFELDNSLSDDEHQIIIQVPFEG